MPEYDAVAVAEPVADVPVAVFVAQLEYEACVADATATENTPIPLLCWANPDSALVGSYGGAYDWAHPCSHDPPLVDIFEAV